MNKYLSVLALLFLTYFQVFSQDNTFYRKYNLGGMQGALQLATTLDGGFVATGQHEGNGSHGDCDIYVYKLDVCGNIEWFNIFGTTAQEGGRSIQQTADSGYIVSGLYSQGASRAFNMKLDANGITQWIKIYPFEWMMYAIEAANGDFISVGTAANQLYIIRTDSMGNIIWSKQINGLGSTSLYIYELLNGDILVSVIGVNNGKDISLCRLDSNGNMLWGNAYGGSGWSDQDHTAWSCKGAVNEPDNSIVITSPTYLGSIAGENILLTKIDLTNGSVLWARSVGGNDRDQSRDIALYPGGYVVLGNSASFPTPVNPNAGIFEPLSEKDILLVAFDGFGNLNWARTYGGSDRDKGIGVRYNFDNGFTVSAYTTSNFFGNTDASMDPLFIKTDSVGIVSCQMASPPIQFEPITLSVTSVGSTSTVNFTASVPPISATTINPNDGYLCQQCISIPIFTPEDTMICVNDTARFFNITTFGLKCFQEWLIEGQAFNGGVDLEWVFTQPGDYEVELYSTCGNNQDTMRTTIHVYDPQISTSNPVCQDGPIVQLTSNMNGGIWAGSGVNDSILGLFSPASANLGWVQIDYSLQGLCSITDSIKVNPKPIADAGWDYQKCYFLDTIIGVANQLGQSYLWNPTSYLSDSSVSNPTFNYTNNSTSNFTLNYVLTVTTDSSGCYDQDTTLISVFARPIVSAGLDSENCQFEQNILSGSGAMFYQWDNNVINGVPFVQNIGTLLYHVTGTDAFGCVNNDSVEIVVHPLPIVFGYPDTSVCQDEWITLYGGGAQSYSWDNQVVNGIAFQQNPGNEVYTVIGTDTNGCQNVANVNVTVWPNPVSFFTVTANDLMFNFNNQSSGAVSYSWDMGDGSSSQSTENVYYYYQDLNGESYNVYLTAISEFGCIDTFIRPVNSPLPLLFYVPNTFTPDGDEFNNVFIPYISGNVVPETYSMSIYNRWGELIFQTKDINIGWDGYNSLTRKCQDGVYTWEIEFKSRNEAEVFKKHGFVNLIR